MSRKIGILMGVIALLMVGTAAWAQGPQGRRGGGPGGPEQVLERIAYGEILSISADGIVLAPQLPPEMAERMEEHGRELPELPAELTIALDEDTRFVLDGGVSSIADFQAGDIVVVVRDRDGIARTVADPQSAQQFMQQRRGQGGPGGNRGDGQGPGMGRQGGPGGPGGRMGERRPPAMGSITAISADSITIAPVIPEEIKQRMEEHGRELPDLPESITWSIDGETRYMTVDGRQDSNPFKVGDMVVVLGPPEEGSARAIIAEEAARQRMQQRGEGAGPGHGGQGQKDGRGKGGKRRGGGQAGGPRR